MGRKLTYANVMSTLCFFLLLGGGAYAAGHLGKNTVGPKQLKKNAVTTAKIKKEAITAAKVKKGTLTGTQINLSTLGTVPKAESANSAAVASSLPPAEPWHEVGTPGEPPFFKGWENESPDALVTAGFYKDQLGIVRLRGAVKGSPESSESIFTLPPGFRPAPGVQTTFTGYCAGGPICDAFSERIDALGSDFYIPELSGHVTAYPAGLVSLSGITFRAES